MENNIFEGIRFGDRFRTRNNHMVVFLFGQKETPRSRKIEYVFAHDAWGIGSHIGYDKNGKSDCGKEYDIISCWKDSIDEEKLDELAKETWTNRMKLASANHVIVMWDNFIDGFKAGYRKAMEE